MNEQQAVARVQGAICALSVWKSTEGTDADIVGKIDSIQTTPEEEVVTWGHRVRHNQPRVFDLTVRAGLPTSGVQACKTCGSQDRSREWQAWVNGVHPDKFMYIAIDGGKVADYWEVDVRLLAACRPVFYAPYDYKTNADGVTGFVAYSKEQLVEANALLFAARA